MIRMWRNENCTKYGGKMGRRSCNREMETVGGGGRDRMLSQGNDDQVDT